MQTNGGPTLREAAKKRGAFMLYVMEHLPAGAFCAQAGECQPSEGKLCGMCQGMPRNIEGAGKLGKRCTDSLGDEPKGNWPAETIGIGGRRTGRGSQDPVHGRNLITENCAAAGSQLYGGERRSGGTDETTTQVAKVCVPCEEKASKGAGD